MKELFEGLRILLKYYPEGSRVETSFDVLRCGNEDATFVKKEMTLSDLADLARRGWFIDEEDFWCFPT